MGLLDSLNTDNGLLGLMLMSAGAPKAVRTGTGEGLLSALQGVQQYKQAQEDRALKQRMSDMQLQQLQMALEQQKRAQANEDAFRAKIPSPQMQASQAALTGGGGPTAANAGRMQPVDPMAQLNYDAMTYGQIKPTDYIASLRKDVSPIKLAAGETLLDPKTFRPMANNPKAEDLPTAIKEYQYAVGQGYKGSLQQFMLEQKRAGATNVSVNTGQKGFDNTLKLRGDFRSEPIYKAHQEMQSAYSQIQQSLKQGTPAGDLAGATKMMKLLDPGSVVRESELGMAMAATGLLDRLQNYATNVAAGTKLTPKQRQEFQALSDALYGESVKQYNSKRGEYQGIAERNGLNTMDVLGSESSIAKTASVVVRTGRTPDGRKVVQRADGSIEYAD